MGPLKGIKVIEFAGIGPSPFCGMMLADMGAEIIRIDRKGSTPQLGTNGALSRGRQSIAIDLKKRGGVEVALKLIEQVDVLIEGYRPGVMEKLGLGPDVALESNPGLIYGRMSGWGQEGPLANVAGHDINYIALSGALHTVGMEGERPVPPLNLVGDFGGGGMLLAFGVVCALLESQQSGKGQVIDAAMVDGATSLMAMIYGLRAEGEWGNERGTNLLDGGAHFYGCYECADGKWLAVGAIEPQFYKLLLEKAGIGDEEFETQMDPEMWRPLRKKLSHVLKQKTRSEWQEILETIDSCVSPVLDLDEAPLHPHMQYRETFIKQGDEWQPAPAPRFDRTPPSMPKPAPAIGEHNREILLAFGWTEDKIEALQASNVI